MNNAEEVGKMSLNELNRQKAFQLIGELDEVFESLPSCPYTQAALLYLTSANDCLNMSEITQRELRAVWQKGETSGPKGITPPPIEVGSTVRLKSGGPRMTVRSVGRGTGEETATCEWFEKGEIRCHYFRIETLTLVDSESE